MADAKWRAWTQEDTDRPRQQRSGPHAWRHVKGFRFPWPYCAHCGLIALKNKASSDAARKPCTWEAPV